MNDYSRKQDGDAKEHFSLIEWLTNEVKLPQYSGVFLEQGFKLPIDCFRIDEVALDLLKIEKIGHRKRILVSCQKLAARYGLTNDVMKSPQIADGGDKGKSSENDGVEMSDKTDAPPNLPPKKGKKLKPAPPPRKSALDDSVAIEQEVNGSGIQNEDVSTEKRTDILGHTNPSDTELKSFESDEQTTIETTNAAENVTKSESVDGLPSGSSVDGYERIWEASEGKPLAASPTEIIDESSNDKCFSEAEVNHKMSTDSGVIDNLQEPTGPPANQSAEPPPIPPRVDLDNTLDSVVASQPSLEKESVDEVLSYASSKSTVENTPLPLSEHVELKPEEKPTMRPKKIPPQKPPRRNKPISVGVQTAHKVEDQEQRNKSSLGSVEDAEPNDVIYENEVFITQNHMPVEEQVSVLKTEAPLTDSLHDPESITKGESLDEDNIYSNVEQSQRIPKVSSSSLDETKGFTKRPIPVPRTKSLSGMPISDLSESAPELPKGTVIKESLPDKRPDGSHHAKPDTGSEGGSGTEDDLSGSDGEEMPEKVPEQVPSEYETVVYPRPASVSHSRHNFKDGYLYKQGGQQNNKGWKKRWVVFDGNELRYYKDKEHTNESLQRVPVAIMREVRIVTEDTKRARFDLFCAGRTYMFALDTDEMDIIQVWAQILMGAIILCRKENQDTIAADPGGDMCDPDKQGYLKKQGNNVVADWKKRYIAIKEDKFAYYHNFEDFILGSPINTLQMNLASVKMDPKSQSRIQLVTPHRTYFFQCEDETELRSWISAMEKSIQLALSDRTVINKIWENPSNRHCADCGQKDPLWASVNLVVCVCARCIGVHRKLGVQTSKPRSLLMDEKIWRPSLIKLMVNVGNNVSNRFWKFNFPEDDQIYSDCSSEEREEFIRNKYVKKLYRHISPLYGDPVALGEALKKVVVTDKIEKTMQLVFSGADVKYVSPESADTRMPYQLAKDANQELQMEFLSQNGANAEPDQVPSSTGTATEDIYEEPLYMPMGLSPGSESRIGSMLYEKAGYLQKKAPSAAVWKRRYFTLRGRELCYDKGDRDDPGVIKLRDVNEYIYNDGVTLDIVTSERTYNLRADTKEDALSWYTVLKNKQVFQVPLANQELGSDGIPHLVAKCLQFVESHGLDTEGIYRKNGNKAKIKVLRKLFDQDADSVMISRDEYEVHDVAGLLKEYFRELPDPLMTEDAYPHFITASFSPDHSTKMYTYKGSLGRLPDVNRNTLKAVIGHLTRVKAHSSKNLMKVENISLIFGPTLMSNKQMGTMDTSTINQEFTVISDFIEFYKWLFDVGAEEEIKDQKIEEAMKKMLKLSLKNSLLEFNELTLDVYSIDKRQESSRITVYSSSKASQISQELVSKRAMAPDGNWALFQVVNGELERPFQATEKVLSTVIETGKYKQLSKDSCLIVKENYVSDNMKAYGFQDPVSLTAAGTFQTMKEAKKKDSWKKLFIKLEKGFLSVHKNAKSRDEIDSWPVNETTLYLGVDKDKKPLTRFGFTIARCAKDNQTIYRYVCFDDEREQYRWVSIFLKLKYFGKNLWEDPDLEPIGFYAEAMVPAQKSPLPREKSNSRLQSGTSAKILNELRLKQRSFKK